MKKIFLTTLSIITIFVLFACGNNKNVSATMPLGGVEYPAIYVKSGYYFDKASLSETTLAEMLEKTELVEKPSSLGEVVIPDISKIELSSAKIAEADDTMIEAEIERERDQEMTFSPVKTKRDAMLTDKVIIDFKGFVDGKELEGGSGEDFELILGSGQFIPGFEEQVVGHKAGKKFTINVTFPEEYTEELAGKPATFDITIKSMEEAHTPEVNDEFAKSHSTKGATTLADYKLEVKNRINERNKYLNDQQLSYDLFDKLIEESKCTPNEEALAWQFSVVIDQIRQQAALSNMKLYDMFTSDGSKVKDVYDQIKSSIPQYISQQMIIDELVKKYKINFTEKDVKDWFENMSNIVGYGNTISYDDYKNYMGYDNLLNSAIQEKAMINAVHDCKIVEKTEEE